MTKHIPYGLRAICVCLAFPTLPALSIALDALEWLPDLNQWIHFIWLFLSLYLWARFSRYMLVTAPYVCSSCGKSEAYIEPQKEANQTVMYYECDSCGYRESSGVAQYSD
jgi:DNA-directed RNA polymerase subunit RPC12/RpoP